MTTSNAQPMTPTRLSAAVAAAKKRDAARRRVRMATLGVAAVTMGASSLGALALAQSSPVDSSNGVVGLQGAKPSSVSAGTGQAPVATSGGS